MFIYEKTLTIMMLGACHLADLCVEAGVAALLAVDQLFIDIYY